MKLINKKLREARTIVGLSQKQLAEFMNLKGHSIISHYESGKLTNVPDYYIDFLLTYKFDLNSLFDDSIKSIHLRNTSNILAEQPVAYEKSCKSCKKHQAKIFELQGQISLLKEQLKECQEKDRKAISA